MGCFSSKQKGNASAIPPSASKSSTSVSKPSHHFPAPVAQPASVKIKAGQFVQYLQQPIYSQYNIIKQLGFGTFGKVYMAEHKSTHQKRAIKELDKSTTGMKDSLQSKFISEVEILSKLDHPNILKVFELFEDDQKYYMVTEACEGGELFDYLIKTKKLGEHVAAHIMFQVFSAVCFCHSNNIVHRDLKPENLLIDSIARNGEISIKVIDFGTSCLVDKSKKLCAKLGTPYYIAPEVLRQDYNEKCDIWSCGVILFILLSGYPPFSGRTDEEIMQSIRTGRYTFHAQHWSHTSDDAKAFIRKLLEVDYNRRPSAEDCLKDPWLQRYHAKTLSSTVTNVDSWENLKSFNSGTHLKQAFMSFIAAQLVSKDQTNQLKEEFQALDTNGDGRLSREELLKGYCRHMPEESALEIVNHVMSTVDTDGSGFIEYSEFIAAAMSHEILLSKNYLEQAFRACDKDNSGAISITELRELLGEGNVENEGLWDRLINEADKNGDGEIDLKEFTNLMLQASEL